MNSAHDVFQGLLDRNPGKGDQIIEEYSMYHAEVEEGQSGEHQLDLAVNNLKEMGIE